MRRLIPKIRSAKAELDEAWLEYERDKLAQLRDAHVPTRRAHMLAIYGAPATDCHGYDGCTRGSGGPSKVFRSVTGNPHSAEAMALSQFTLLTASVHANTNKTYQSAVKPWFAWRMLGALDPHICDAAPHKVKQQELMDFYCYHAETVNWSPSWLHVQLYAIRFYHMLKGTELDLRTMARLSAAKKGFKRNYGGPQRKVAATVELLHEVYANGGLDYATWDGLLLLTAICTAFAFLLRSSEYLRKAEAPDAEKCLRVEHVIVALRGEDCHAPEGVHGNEVVIFHPGSKNDWMGQGSSNNIFEDPDNSPLCVVRLFNLLREMRPRFFSAVGTHLFTLTSGFVIHRDLVEQTLREAAERLNLPGEMFSTHSLRAGGATAMWAAKYAVEEIQRRGRWVSQCFRIYIWEGRERAAGIAQSIFHTSVSMFAAMKAATNRR